MVRIVAVLLAVGLLGALYWSLGGFESGPVLPDGLEAPALADAAGGPPIPTATGGDSDPAVVATAPTGLAQANPEGTSQGATLDTGVERVTIGRGESFYAALERVGVDHDAIMELVAACRPHVDLKRVRRGDAFDLMREDGGKLRSVRMELDAAHYLVATAEDAAGFSAQLHSYPVERWVKGVRGVIRSNLFDALRDADAEPWLAAQLAEVLGFDIDFFRDLRRGDAFTILFEEFIHAGRPVREGRLLAVQFVNRGHVYEAYSFENELGAAAYFDGDGRSLQKQFLRAPLRFDRISSGYAHSRFHPILKYYRPHEGVDYAAPVGTPVRATADGTVVTRERYHGFGNHVVLKHGAEYQTWYLHLSSFAAGLNVGKRVQQGDVIGYVGSTGLSTAPHLCYRIKKSGRFINPQRLVMPPSDPVPAARRAEFTRERDEFRALLASVPQGPGVAQVVAQGSPPSDATAVAGTAPSAVPPSPSLR